LKNIDVAYFTASVDDAETNRKFAESLQLNYPILSDPDKSVAKAYGVLSDSGKAARRWTYYINKKGIVTKIDKKVKAKTSGEDIVKNLKELGLAD